MEEIKVEVWRLRTGRAEVPLGTREENMQVWIRGAAWKQYPDKRQWEKLVSVTKLAFREGCILTSLAWMTMVITPKGGRDYTGIGLVEVIWKVCAAIMNNRIRTTTTLHYSLHGCRHGKGEGTATMEEKLAQQLTKLVQ